MHRENSAHRIWYGWVFLATALLWLGSETARADSDEKQCEEPENAHSLQLAELAIRGGCHDRAATLMEEILKRQDKPSLKLMYMGALAHWMAGHKEQAIALWWRSGCWEEKDPKKKEAIHIPLDCDVPESMRRSASDSLTQAALAQGHEPAPLVAQPQRDAKKQQQPPQEVLPAPAAGPGSRDATLEQNRFVGSRRFWGLIGGGVVIVAAGSLTLGLYLWKKDAADYPGQIFITGQTSEALSTSQPTPQPAMMVRF